MDPVGPVIEILKCLGPPICGCINDNRRLDGSMNKLKKKLIQLEGLEKDTRLQLDAGVGYWQRQKEAVKIWLERVEKIKDDTNSIEEEVKKRKFLKRSCLTKKVDKMIEDVADLVKEAPSDNLFINNPLKGLELPSNSIKLAGQLEKMDEILSYLRGDETAKIGVWGLEGVGKTTIMRLVNNQLLREEKFQKVIWDSFSMDHEIDIARAFDESITDPDKARRAAKISGMLGGKKFVLILDGVWKPFDLEEIGISGSLENNGCKLVLTTHSKEVCISMGCKTVRVDTLRQEEARSLFLMEVGFDIFSDPNLGSIANDVLGKCGGLPVAISKVGEAMRSVRDIHMWRSARKDLTQGNWSIVKNQVPEKLKVSYDMLGDEKVQQCFLYCCRCYSEDEEIPKKQLIERWISGGYLNDEDKGHVILSKLENNGLLEKCGDGDDSSVKMHALIRDMAVYIGRNAAEVDYNDMEKHHFRPSTITTEVVQIWFLCFFGLFLWLFLPSFLFFVRYRVHWPTSKSQETLGRLRATWGL